MSKNITKQQQKRSPIAFLLDFKSSNLLQSCGVYCNNINPNTLTPCVQHEGTNNPHQQASQHTHKGGKKERDWVIPKMNVPCSFWAHNTKLAKGNIGIIWWGIPNVSRGLNCQGLNDKYMLLVVESDSAGCPKVLCDCQHYSICPWRCWLKMLSSARVVFCA